MEQIKKNPKFWIAVAAVFVLILLILPVDIPYSIYVQGKVLAGEE